MSGDPTPAPLADASGAPGDDAAGDAPHGVAPVPERLRRGTPRAVLAALPGARAVGGCVRDALAGRPIADVDVGVPLPPEDSSARLRAAGLRVFDTGLAHGTVTAVLNGEPVEVTSLRRDVATDGRRATVAWTRDWREDAARRDFTVNAMSMDGQGRLWDWFGGRADLAAGIVRFVGDPATRLREDHLRALRFFRFQARYGAGLPDAAAVAAIRGAVPGLAALSAERVWGEIKRLLAAPEPSDALVLVADTGVLGAVLPDADPAGLPGLRRAIAAGMPPDPVARLVSLLPPGRDGLGERIAQRLRLSGAERDALLWLQDRAVPDGGPASPDDDALRRWLAARRDPAMPCREAWAMQARDGRDRAALRARIAATPHPVFPLLGRDALALGARPGPLMGRLLRDAEAWWLKGGCTADAERCRAHLARLVAAAPLPGG